MRILLLLTALFGACAPVGDQGDLRPEAVLINQLAKTPNQGALTTLDVVDEPPEDLPVRVRVWRRSQDTRQDSCTGVVEEIPLEDYVAGVLPSEWMASWEPAALDAGAIAVRTFAAFWAQVGGKYRCADVDDTVWSQVYTGKRHPSTDAAVTRTEGAVVTLGGHLVYAEYSAEQGAKTAFGVSDGVCAGAKVQGHRRGLCQWGSQRWARRGRDAPWILHHYYPGARVSFPHEDLRDGVPLEVYSGESFELALTATNPGPDDWPAGVVRVGSEPSAFADESWLSETRPRTHDAALPAGERAMVTWQLTAPVVATQTTFEEFFWLEPQMPGGSEGIWRITVHPPIAQTEPEPDPSPRSYGAWGWAALALGIACGLLGLRLWWARSQRRTEP